MNSATPDFDAFDYFTLTSNSSPENVIEIVKSHGLHLAPHAPKGMNFFRRRLDLLGTSYDTEPMGHILWDNPQCPGMTHVILRGGCDEYAKALQGDVRLRGSRTTRADCAMTVSSSSSKKKLLKLAKIARDAGEKVRVEGLYSADRGITVYIGSRGTSEFFGRFYQKGLQLIAFAADRGEVSDADPDAIRAEFEMTPHGRDHAEDAFMRSPLDLVRASPRALAVRSLWLNILGVDCIDQSKAPWLKIRTKTIDTAAGAMCAQYTTTLCRHVDRARQNDPVVDALAKKAEAGDHLAAVALVADAFEIAVSSHMAPHEGDVSSPIGARIRKVREDREKVATAAGAVAFADESAEYRADQEAASFQEWSDRLPNSPAAAARARRVQREKIVLVAGRVRFERANRLAAREAIKHKSDVADLTLRIDAERDRAVALARLATASRQHYPDARWTSQYRELVEGLGIAA